jgi:hypothetical protein
MLISFFACISNDYPFHLRIISRMLTPMGRRYAFFQILLFQLCGPFDSVDTSSFVKCGNSELPCDVEGAPIGRELQHFVKDTRMCKSYRMFNSNISSRARFV